MPQQVDTRLVQIKLDSSDFQKNAEKTQKSIKELEKQLEMKDAAKGFDSITKAANKVDLSGTTSQISAAIKKFFGLQKDAADSLGGITKASDKVDMSNIAAAANDVAGDVAKFGADGAASILGLGSAADKVDMSPISVAVDEITGKFSVMEAAAFTAIQNITNKIVDGASQWLKNMAFGDIINGWEAYADKTQSVQTMMSATRQDYDQMVQQGLAEEGKQIEWVEGQMDKLAWYTDETSYNFLDMANNIGKFTSQGINLEAATNQMIGIANWGAMAGANAGEVSRAMYNISQAMGTGAMKLIDWKSIENANMATKEFKEQVMETAVAQGTLERVSDGIYHVIGANEDAIVSASNFNEQLSTGWFSSGIMQETFDNFGKFSNELYEFQDMVGGFEEPIDEAASTYMDWVEKWKKGDTSFLNELELTETEAKALTDALTELSSAEYELSLRSFRAGQEAKTFREAIDSVHDAAKTAWGGLFQEIFGNYEQGKVLWTGLANSMWSIFVGPLKTVQRALHEWNQSDEYGELAEGAVNAMDVIATAVNAFQDGILDAFGFGSKAEIVETLKEWSRRLGEFLGNLELTEDRAAKIKSIAKGIGTTIKALFKVVSKIFGTVLPPLFQTLGVIFQIVDAIVEVKDESEATGKSTLGILDRILGVVKSVLGIIPSLLGGVLDAIKMFKNDDAFGGIGALIVAPFESLTMAILDIFGFLTGKDMQNVKERVSENFFGAIIGAIRAGLEKIVSAGKTVIQFFKDLPGKIADAWSGMNAWMFENWGWSIEGVFETVKTAVGGFVSTLREFFGEVGKLFQTGFTAALTSPEEIREKYGVVAEIFYRIAAAVAEAWKKIRKFFASLGKSKEVEDGTEKAGFFARAWQVVKDIFKGIIDVAKKVGNAIQKAYKAVDDGVARLTGKNIKQHFDDIRASVLVTWEKVKSFFSSFAKDKDVDDSNEKIGLFQKLWDGLKKVGSAIADWGRAVFPVLQAAFQAFWEKVSPILQKIKEGLGSVNWGDVAKGGGLAAIGIALIKLFKQTDGVVGEDGLGGILKNVKEVCGSLKEYFQGLTKQGEEMTKKIKAQQILMIAGAVAILVASMMAISTLDSEGFTNGLTAISSFMVELAAFFVIVDDSTKNASDLTKIGAGLLVLTLAITILVHAMMKFKDMSWDELSVGLAALSGIIGLFVVFAKLVDTTNAEGIAKIAAAMAIMAKAVAWMVPPMLLMAAIETSALKQGLLALGAILLELAAFLYIANDTKVALESSGALAVIAATILKMIPSIIMLGKMDVWTLVQGVAALGAIMAELALFMILADKTKVAIENSAAIVAIAGAMLMLIAPVKQLGEMRLEDVATGVVAVGALMAAFGGFLQIANKATVAIQNVAAIVAIAGAITMLINPLIELSYLRWDELLLGVGTIAAITGILAGFLLLIANFGSDSGDALSMVAASVAMVIMAGAIRILVGAFMELSGVEWPTIWKGLAILGGAVLALAIAAFAMSKALPGLIGLSAVLLSLGGMVFMAGTGFMLFAQGLAIVAAMGDKAGTALKAIGNALAETIPGIMNAVAGNIGTFLKTLFNGIVGVLDEITPALTELVARVAALIVGLFVGVTQEIREHSNEIKLGLQTLVDIVFAVISEVWGELLEMLYVNWPTFFAFIKQALSDLWDLLVEFTPKIIRHLVATLKDLLNVVSENIGDIVNKVIDIANKVVTTLTERMPEIVEILFNLLMSIITNVIDQTVKNLPTIFQKLWELTDALLTQLVEFIVGTEERKGLTQMVTEAILLIIADLTKNIAEFTEAMLVVVIEFLAALNDALWTHKDDLVAELVDVVVIATEFAFDLVINTINSLAETLLEKTPEVREALLNLADAAFKSLLEFFGIDTSGISELFSDTGGNIIKGLIEGIKNIGKGIWNKIKEPFITLWEKVCNFFGIKSPSKKFEGAGGNIMDGLINGIKSFATTIWEKIKAPFVNLWNGVKKFFGIDKGPSTEFEGAGEDITAGLENGINKSSGEGSGSLWGKVKGTFQGLWNGFTSLFEIHSPSKVFERFGGNITSGLTEGINSSETSLWNSVKAPFDNVLSGMQKLFGSGPQSAFGKIATQSMRDFADALVGFNRPENIWGYAKVIFTALLNNTKSLFGNRVMGNLGNTIMSEFATGMRNYGLWANTRDWFLSVYNNTRSAYGVWTPAPIMQVLGDQIMAGFAAGIKGYGGAGGLWSQVEGTFTAFIMNVRTKFRIHSPSKVFEDIGENVDKGFIQGIGNLQPQVDASSMGLADSALTTLKDYLSDASASVTEEVGDPVIKPVMDLSEIQNGSGKLADMLNFSDTGQIKVGSDMSGKLGGLLSFDSGKNIGQSLASLLTGGLATNKVNVSQLSSMTGSEGHQGGGAGFDQVINFNITPTPNQDVNAIADAVERKLTRGIKQRGASF